MQTGMRVTILSGILIILFCILPVTAEDTEGHDKIVYISSYGPSYVWNQEIEEGVNAALADSERTRIQLSIEYLDAKVISDDTHFENLYQTFSHKYAGVHPDVVIISDDSALLFMNEYGDRLFPGVPVVFTGINNASNLPDTDEGPFYVGTVEVLPFRETLDMIQTIHPGTDTIYVILDNTYTGQAIKKQFEEQTAVYADEVTFRYPAPGSDIDAISTDLAALPDTAAAIIITYYLADQDLTPYHIDEISAELSDASPVPIYSAVSMFNNKGILGGVQLSPYDLGYDAGTHALWVLNEQPLSHTGPVIYEPDATAVFDYAGMQRFGISESALPDGATVINRPPDSVTVDRGVAFGVTATALILGVLVVILITQNMALAKTRALLAKSEKLYRSVVESQTEMITRFQTDGTIIFINPAYARYFGLDAEAARGTKFRAEVHDEDRERVEAHFAALRAGRAHLTIEQRIVLDDGTVRWHRWEDHAISDEDGRVTEYQSVGMDITDEIEAQNVIQNSLQEKTVLLQEVHHRVKNNLAVISSMLEMQAVKEEERNPYVAIQIREAEGRIRSMAAVHEELYRSDSFGTIHMQSHVERLAGTIVSTFPNADCVTVTVQTDDCALSLQKAIPVSLVLNELITNAMKYAFPDRAKGIISIDMQYCDANIRLTVGDTGVGLPEGFRPKEAQTLGIRMVQTFVEYQLDGRYEITTGPEGTIWTIEFPRDTEPDTT